MFPNEIGYNWVYLALQFNESMVFFLPVVGVISQLMKLESQSYSHCFYCTGLHPQEYLRDSVEALGTSALLRMGLQHDDMSNENTDISLWS